MYLNMPYPDNTFLFLPNDRFADFLTVVRETADLNPYFGHSSAQYPFLLLVMNPFAVFLDGVNSFLLYSGLFVLFFIWFNSHYLRSDTWFDTAVRIFVFSFMTYPFLFMLDRGNLESVVFIFMALFIYFLQKEKYILSSLFLSCAIATKLFPLLLLMLLLAEKRYKEMVLALAGAVGLTAISLLFFDGGFLENAHYLLSGKNLSLNDNFIKFTGENNFVQRGVTLFTFLKVLSVELEGVKDLVWTLLDHYYLVVGTASLLLAGYVALVERVLWRKVTVLVFACILFPHLSADYKLIHVFIPLSLFIASDQKEPHGLFFAVLFALLLVPKDYYFFPDIVSDSLVSDISISVLLNPLIMLVMLCVIIFQGLKNSGWHGLC